MIEILIDLVMILVFCFLGASVVYGAGKRDGEKQAFRICASWHHHVVTSREACVEKLTHPANLPTSRQRYENRPQKAG